MKPRGVRYLEGAAMTYAALITDAAPSSARNGLVWLLTAVALFLWVAVLPAQLLIALG